MNIKDHKNEESNKDKFAAEKITIKTSTKNSNNSLAISNSVLANLNLHIVVIDLDGFLISVNSASEDLVLASSPLYFSESLLGSNYFTLCNEALSAKDDVAESILKQILLVHQKQQKSFSSEYTIKYLEEDSTYLISVFRLLEDDSKLVITHQNSFKNKDVEKSSTQLKSKLAELTTLVDFSLDVICTINSSGNIVTVNRAVENILGYTTSEIVNLSFLTLIFEDDIANSLNVFNRIIDGDLIPLFENRCVHKDGNIVPFLWSINYDKNYQLFYCVGKDMTVRKRLEKAVTDERDQFNDIFQKAPSGIGMLKGPTHIFEMANPFYLQLINKQNIIGKTVEEILPEVADQGFIKILDYVFKTGESHIGREVLVKVRTSKNKGLIDYYINYVYQACRNSAGEIDGIQFFINDVTEQVEIKKQIEASEKQYRRILETAQEGIWVLDKNSRTTFVNKKICDTFGYTEKEILGKKNTYFMDEGSKLIAMNALDKRKEGKSENLEVTFISKKGEKILSSISATPIFDDAGKFAGSLGMLSNITEKRHLENLLDKSNRLARIGSWEIDVVNSTVFWSDITKEIREVDANYVPDLETGIGYFTAGIDKKIISERVEQCIEHGTAWDEELQITTFKGNLKWVRTIGEAVLVNGKCRKIYGSFQDITERKNAVEKVLRSETRLNIAQLIAQVGSWEINVETNDQSWSAEFYRILEVDLNVVPSFEAFLPLIHQDDRASAITAMNDALANQIDSSFNFRFTRENGDLGYASSEWKFEYDCYGNPLYVYGILRDLTNEKKAENERAKMISDITQRNKDLEQFSYIISHNLRSPVANIIGLAEELKHEGHSAESKLMLTEALSNDVKRLENVIVDLNTILQTKREITERKEIVNLTELVDNIKLSINDLILKQGVQITTDFSEIEEAIIIKSYIHSIFYNLISNSIKYRQDDCEALIMIKSQMINGNLIIIFTDNGRGIDLLSKGDQIFGLYKRFHSDTEGKGMGLYMVKTQVESLGGKISVSSEVDFGTTFTIEFENNLYI